jgi:hypothetical protein
MEILSEINDIQNDIQNNKQNIDKTTFFYDALKFLIQDENEILSILQENYEKLFLVPYKINLDGPEPFNTILLWNNIKDNNLVFPELNIDFLGIKNISDYNLFTSIIKCYLFSLNIHDNYENFEKNCNFKGVYLYNNSIYVFIDFTKLDIDVSLIYRDSLSWFVLMDEIVNKKNVCNLNIGKEVTNFFLNNPMFLYFKNSNYEPIEIPTVVYSGTHEKLLPFNYLFGKSKDDSNSLLGSNYYFTDFTNAVRKGGWSNNYDSEFRHGVELTDKDSGKYKKGGIIRYAIFLGNCLIKENIPNDKIDESDIKKMNLDNYYEKLTLRISDHDSTWVSSYDSVFLGEIELDDGQLFQESPMYVIKDFANQIPLSYHIINKIFLKEKFCKNDNYHIL